MDYFYNTLIATIIFAMTTMVVHTKNNTFLSKKQKGWFVFSFILVAFGAAAECAGVFADIFPVRNTIHTLIKVSEFSITVALPACIAIACGARKSGITVGVLAILHSIFEIAAAQFHLVIDYDAECHYIHGRFYFIYIAAYILSFVYLLITLFVVSNKFGDRDIGTLIMLLFTSLVCVIPTFLFDGVKTSYLAIAIISIIFYIYYVNLTEQAVSAEVKRAYATIERLAVDCEAVFNVNLITEAVMVFSITPFVKQMADKVLNTVTRKAGFSRIIRELTDIYIVPEDREQVIEFLSAKNMRKLLEDRRIVNYNIRTVIDGEMHYFVAKIVSSKETPDLVTFGLINSDIAVAEQQREEAKKRENNRIIEILASEYSSVYYVDLNTDVLIPYAMNADEEKEFGKIFRDGIRFSDAYRMYVDSVVYEPDKEKMILFGSIESIKNILTNKKAFVTTFRSLKDGIPRFCEMKLVKVDSADSTATAVALGFADRDNEIISRFVDSKLREEYASVFLTDLETNTYRCLQTSVLNGFEDITGGAYTDELCRYLDFVDDEYKELWKDLCDPAFVKDYLRNEDRRELIYTIHGTEQIWRRAVFQVIERKDGIPVMIILTFIALDNFTAERYELNRKIEEQKDELLRQQNELEIALRRAESANRAKTTFLSNMSHDIRTPMNAIIGFTNLALQNLDAREKVEDYLEKTSTSCQHLLSLINDILDMSRIESGKIRLEEMDSNLSDIMHDIHTIILGQANAKKQGLFFNNINVTDEDVVVDKLRLHQVLLNLLSNAIKFTPVGGEIHVYIKQLSGCADSATYEFHVKDNGIGMSPEFVSKMFEPFEREHSSTVSGIQGTGLGMSITKKIVDLMGGRIDVISEQGKGSEFIVTVSLKLQKTDCDISRIMSFDGKRALIIDDDKYSCEGAAGVLERLGMKPEIALNGNDGIALASKAKLEGNAFSLYLVDWLVPDIDGIKIIKTIRENVSETAPVIVMTSYDIGSVEEEAAAAGANGFLPKPVFYSEVFNLLQKLAGGHEDVPEQEEETGNFEGKRILLVEDNELNREIAQEILEEYGFIVDTAEDGIYAVEKIRVSMPGAYDIILMDIQMPIMDGYTAAKNIRGLENHELADIPIIAMTANAFLEDKQHALEVGMNDHISKPIDVKILCGTLKKYL